MDRSQNTPRRKSLRLKGFDYSQPGAYFITICTQNRKALFGEVIHGRLHSNDAGRMICSVWQDLRLKFPTMIPDEFIVMPNHFHGMFLIQATNLEGQVNGEAFVSVSRIVQAFKSLTTHAYMQGVREHHWPRFEGKLWQRNYWEHIVRNDSERNRIRRYICNNPENWNSDPLVPSTEETRESLPIYNYEPWMM